MPRKAPTHRPANIRAKTHGDRQARRALPTYSATWRRLREQILVRDEYTCRHCGRYGNHVDHVDNDSHNNAESNLQTLCAACHSTKTAQEQAGKPSRPKVAVNADGSPEAWR
jgi:5-methylcytosine-specific restriction protein A